MIEYSFSISDLEYFLLILTRVSCFVYVAPFFGTVGTPARVKAGFSILTSILLYVTLTPADAPAYDTILGYAMMVVREASTGLLIGFGTIICIAIINFAGSIIDMEIGLSMVQAMDPLTRQDTSITGVFYQYIMMLFMIVSGMYRFLLGAIADSFLLIPVNGAIFRSDALYKVVLTFLGDFIVIGFRICLPVFCVGMLLNAILAILTRVSPQMNMFAIGIQMRIVAGLVVLFLTAGMMPGAANFIFEEMKKVVNNIVYGGLM